jgi:hypothetical protein
MPPAAVLPAERGGNARPAIGFRCLGDKPGHGHHDFESCSGLPLRFVEAMSRSSISDIDFSIEREAPFSAVFLMSPRLAASAAPAAFCWAFDFAGMVISFAGFAGVPPAP